MTLELNLPIDLKTLNEFDLSRKCSRHSLELCFQQLFFPGNPQENVYTTSYLKLLSSLIDHSLHRCALDSQLVRHCIALITSVPLHPLKQCLDAQHIPLIDLD